MFQIANIFSADLVKYRLLQPIHHEMISLLTASLESPKLQVTKAAASALFNLTQVILKDDVTPDDDDLICIIVGLLEALSVFEKKGTVQDHELKRLLLICLGGMIIVGKKSSNPVESLLVSLEASEILSKIPGEEVKEVLSLFTVS